MASYRTSRPDPSIIRTVPGLSTNYGSNRLKNDTEEDRKIDQKTGASQSSVHHGWTPEKETDVRMLFAMMLPARRRCKPRYAKLANMILSMDRHWIHWKIYRWGLWQSNQVAWNQQKWCKVVCLDLNKLFRPVFYGHVQLGHCHFLNVTQTTWSLVRISPLENTDHMTFYQHFHWKIDLAQLHDCGSAKYRRINECKLVVKFPATFFS